MLYAPPVVWPWHTLIVNLVGCVLIGIAARRVQRGSLHWDFAVTGVLGGFTTMSAFAVELNAMVDTERTSLAVIYAVVTIAAGVGATLLAGSAAAPEIDLSDVDSAETDGADGIDLDEAGNSR
jgi:CrcB protein